MDAHINGRKAHRAQGGERGRMPIRMIGGHIRRKVEREESKGREDKCPCIC